MDHHFYLVSIYGNVGLQFSPYPILHHMLEPNPGGAKRSGKIDEVSRIPGRAG
jgi:hypothetical protein